MAYHADRAIADLRQDHLYDFAPRFAAFAVCRIFFVARLIYRILPCRQPLCEHRVFCFFNKQRKQKRIQTRMAASHFYFPFERDLLLHSSALSNADEQNAKADFPCG